jgi:hypothetical protein
MSDPEISLQVAFLALWLILSLGIAIVARARHTTEEGKLFIEMARDNHARVLHLEDRYEQALARLQEALHENAALRREIGELRARVLHLESENRRLEALIASLSNSQEQ